MNEVNKNCYVKEKEISQSNEILMEDMKRVSGFNIIGIIMGKYIKNEYQDLIEKGVRENPDFAKNLFD